MEPGTPCYVRFHYSGVWARATYIGSISNDGALVQVKWGNGDVAGVWSSQIRTQAELDEYTRLGWPPTILERDTP